MKIKPNLEQITFAIANAAEAYNLDAELLTKQCHAESSFNQDAVSGCGAIGLFQLMPATAKELGVNPKVWQENIAGGAKYMATLLRRYNRDYAKALAAYNWGMGHLDKLLKGYPNDWRVRLPKETRDYLNKILGPDLPTAA